MGHEVDWSKFPKPWNTLGPLLQAAVRQDTARIMAGLVPHPPLLAPQGGPPPHRNSYAKNF